jgi:hypothetical protein
MVFIESRTAKIDGMHFCRMFADTPAELEAMAARVGLDLAWKKQADTPIEHFLMTVGRRDIAVRNGAVVMDTEAVIARLRERERGGAEVEAVRNSPEWARIDHAVTEIQRLTQALAASEPTIGFEAAAAKWVLGVRLAVSRVAQPMRSLKSSQSPTKHPPVASPQQPAVTPKRPAKPGTMW